jgi:hypothetical protein
LKAKVISFTVIYALNEANCCVVIAENEKGERFVAQSIEAEVIAAAQSVAPFGRAVSVTAEAKENHFVFCD